MVGAALALVGFVHLRAVATAATETAPPEPIIVSLTFNGLARGERTVLMTHDGDFWLARGDYEAFDLKVRPTSVTRFEGNEYISLNVLAAFTSTRVRFDERRLAIEATLPADVFREKSVAVSEFGGISKALRSGTGAFANYNMTLSHRDADDHALALRLSTEIGGYVGGAFVRHENAAVSDSGRPRVTRVATQVIFDLPGSVSRVTLLDTVGSSGFLGSTVALGGVSWASYYPMAPQLIRTPLAAITGSVESASVVDIYSNGSSITRQRLSPGAFEIRNIPSSGGARTLEVSITDAGGRVRRFELPYYFSDTSLRQGLHDFSYALGRIRQEVASGAPRYTRGALLATHQYGLSDSLTVGARAEASALVANVGASLALRADAVGLLSLDVAASNDRADDRRGHALQLTYSFQAPHGGVRVSARSLSRFYRTLLPASASSGDAALIPIAQERRISANFRPSDNWFLSVEGAQTRDAIGRRGQTLGLNVSYRAAASVNVTGGVRRVRQPGQEKTLEGFVGVSWIADQRLTGVISSRKINDLNVTTASVSRIAEQAEGVGFRLDAERGDSRSEHYTALQPHVRYNGRWAVVTADATLDERGPGRLRKDLTLAIEGGATLIAGRVEATRPINDGFGIVEIGAPLSGVRVYLNNLLVGTTDAAGRAQIPLLASFQDNRVRLDHRDIPLDYALDQTEIRVVPAFRAGVRIAFNAYRARTVAGRVAALVNGQPIALPRQRLSIQSANGRKLFSIEDGGEFYVESIAPGRYTMLARSAAGACTIHLVVPEVAENIYVELKDTLHCE